MTGQKNRFKTTEKLWDLDDKQLKTPKHDAMVLWLMDENNYSNYFDFKSEIENVNCIDNQGLDFRSDIQLEKIIVKSEFPIMSSKTFIAGYVDLVIIGNYKIDDSYTIMDTVINREYDYNINHLIEIKPRIDSFGAVLRQINSYKQFRKSARLRNEKDECFYLFTLDYRFDTQFESQGIKVLHPPEEITIEDMVKMYDL